MNEDLLGDETLVGLRHGGGDEWAADGMGRSSPYTSALLAHLDEPLEILMLFRRVRAGAGGDERGATSARVSVAAPGALYLSGAPAVEVTVEAAAPDVADVDVTELDVAQLRELAVRGEADAQSELGRRYEVGRDGVERDYGEALTWYRRAAGAGTRPRAGPPRDHVSRWSRRLG